MPYVFVEELGEGQEEADVVARNLYDAVIVERDEISTQRDTLVGQVESLGADLRSAKQKYADAVLTSSQAIKDDAAEDVKRDGKPQTFAELWSRKEG